MNSDLAKKVIENYLAKKKITFKKEYQFLQNRKFRIDYFLPDYQIAIEFEGGIWNRGRHVRAVGFLKDVEKYNLLAFKNIWLLRATADIVKDGSFLKILDMIFSQGEKKRA